MERDSELGRLTARLRANLAMAGIPATEADIEGMRQQGYLATAADFERAIDSVPRDQQPDFPFQSLTKSDVPFPGYGVVGQADRAATDQRAIPPDFRAEDPLAFASAREVAALLRARKLSSVELTVMALGRIARRDPALNAFQVVFADEALAAARDADREIGQDRYRGPYHGLPVAVKDLLAMRGAETYAGSSRPWPGFNSIDSAAVERLHEGGAVIVGKTRLSEFAYSPGSNNAHYGPTANPWAAGHDTGGSSSGSGAAVAAGLVYAALGTDTGGSIRIPSAFCGIVGLKPSHGRTSLHGGVTLSWSLDHLGPMTRSVADSADLLDLLAGPDPRDPRTLVAAPVQPARSLTGLRIGVLDDNGSGTQIAADSVLAGWRRGLDAMAASGAELVPVDLAWLEPARLVNGTLLVLEAFTLHEERLRTGWGELGEFPRRRLLQALLHGPSAGVRAAQARAMFRQQVWELFARIDLLSTPTMPFGAPKLGVPGENRFTSPFNLLGLPALSVPVGLTTEGLPIGLQLIGPPGAEATVLTAGAALERSGIWATA